jgi:hypothetical protein
MQGRRRGREREIGARQESKGSVLNAPIPTSPRKRERERAASPEALSSNKEWSRRKATSVLSIADVLLSPMF